MAQYFAKLKVGDKVRVMDGEGLYPVGYSQVRFRPREDEIGLVGVVVDVVEGYANGQVPDYHVTIEGQEDALLLDEVHLIAEKPAAPLIVQPAIDRIEVALRILASIEAKLDGLDQRLAEHERRANPVITINVDGAVQVAEKAVAQHLSNACEEVALPEPASDGWLYEFDEWMQVPIGTEVEVRFPNDYTSTFTITDNHYNFIGESPMNPGDTQPLELDELWWNSRDMKALRVIR